MVFFTKFRSLFLSHLLLYISVLSYSIIFHCLHVCLWTGKVVFSKELFSCQPGECKCTTCRSSLKKKKPPMWCTWVLYWLSLPCTSVLSYFCTFPASLWWNWLISYCTGCAALASYSMIPAFGYILKFLHFVFQRILVLTNKCVNCIMTLCFWSHLRIRVSQFCAGYTISDNYTQQRCNE